MTIKKLLSVFVLNLLISVPTYATGVEQKNIKFMPSTETLMRGDVHVSFELLSVKKLKKKYPDLVALDSLGFTKEREIKVLVAKSAYVVNKPAGFFDHLNPGDEKFLSHIMGEQRVEKIKENDFRLVVPGASQAYSMKTYFDSDDISTLPNSKVIRAVTQARKLDVISQSATSTIFREFSNFTHSSVGGVQVSTYVPLKENKTLILSYTLNGIKKGAGDRASLKKSFHAEVESQQQLINSFQSE